MNDRIGRIQTVRGLIEPSELGRTLMHEHLLFDLRALHRRADWDSDGSFANAPATPRVHARARWDWFANIDELVVADEALAIEEVDCGWGFAHLMERVWDGFRWAGMADREIETMFVDTPRRLLTFVEPSAHR